MEIRAFKGFRFDDGVVGNAGDCVAPPYDVIDGRMQEALYQKNPHNIVRIIKGKESSGDSETDNKYTRAGKFADELISSGALKEDSAECIYAYIQDFEIGGENIRRSGLVAIGKLSEFGKGVQPHEKTLEGPKADRLKLMHAKAAQMGQIFMLYDDMEKVAEGVISKAASKASLIDFVDDGGVRHRLYAIDGQDDIESIVKMMAGKMAVIADGHHRYETALKYYAETKNPAAQYRMMTFVNMRNEGLIVLPTHRLVAGLAEFDIDKLMGQIEDTFEITRYSFGDEDEKSSARDSMFGQMGTYFAEDRNALGIYAATGCFYTVVLKDGGSMTSAYPEMSGAAASLDVNVLHKLILEKHLGIGEKELASQSNIEYVKDIGDAIDASIAKVDGGSSQAVFFMNPTKIEQVQAVAAAGEKMPQKSTFFYPKVFTGLVINKL